MSWIFDGIGTAIVSSLLSLLLGGIVGYKYGVKKTVKQIQTAKGTSKQRQEITNEDQELEKGNINISQKQKADNDAEQIQVGRIK